MFSIIRNLLKCPVNCILLWILNDTNWIYKRLTNKGLHMPLFTKNLQVFARWASVYIIRSFSDSCRLYPNLWTGFCKSQTRTKAGVTCQRSIGLGLSIKINAQNTSRQHADRFQRTMVNVKACGPLCL